MLAGDSDGIADRIERRKLPGRWFNFTGNGYRKN